MPRRYFKKHLTDSQIQQIQTVFSSLDYGTDIKLGEAYKHDCAVVFFDLCNFTNISWTIGESTILEILQELFRFTSAKVNSHDGMIDKYPGDGVVAFFPRNYSIETDYIVEGALDCIAEVMYWFYDHFRLQYDLPKPSHQLDLAVGIDAGKISIAHVGSIYHSEIILLGDQVNCASKCQQVATCKELVIGQDAANRVRRIYSNYFSTGPSTGIIYTKSNSKYLSYRFDWEMFSKNSSWIDKP